MRFDLAGLVPSKWGPSRVQVAFFAVQVGHSWTALNGMFVIMRSSLSPAWTSIPLPSPKQTDADVKQRKSLSTTKPHMTCGRLYFRQFFTMAILVLSIAFSFFLRRDLIFKFLDAKKPCQEGFAVFAVSGIQKLVHVLFAFLALDAVEVFKIHELLDVALDLRVAPLGPVADVAADEVILLGGDVLLFAPRLDHLADHFVQEPRRGRELVERAAEDLIGEGGGLLDVVYRDLDGLMAPAVVEPALS